MRFGPKVQSRRKMLCLGTVGVMLAASGCGGGEGASGGPAGAEEKAAQEAERAAREKAYGAKPNNPGKTKTKR
jgi:hypothetical protein